MKNLRFSVKSGELPLHLTGKNKFPSGIKMESNEANMGSISRNLSFNWDHQEIDLQLHLLWEFSDVTVGNGLNEVPETGRVPFKYPWLSSHSYNLHIIIIVFKPGNIELSF